MVKEMTVSAGVVSVETKEALKKLAYEARLSQRQVLENLIKNAQIVRTENNS